MIADTGEMDRYGQIASIRADTFTGRISCRTERTRHSEAETVLTPGRTYEIICMDWNLLFQMSRINHDTQPQ